MKIISIDYESYYDKKGCSVTDLGVPNYVKAADAYLMSIATADGVWCGTLEEYNEGCPDILKPDVDEDQFMAANSNFDQGFWEKYFPSAKKPWHCVLDQAKVAQLPGNMAQLSRQVLGITLDKEVRDYMCGKHWKDLTPAEQERVVEYCAEDATTELELLTKLPPMSDFEKRVALHTRMINRRGVAINEEAVAKALNTLVKVRHAALMAIPWSVISPPLSHPQFTKWCAGRGVQAPASVAKGDLECATWEAAHPDEAIILKAMREFRRANTLLEKIKSLKNRLVDGILPLEFIYCGAPHTRRWSCRGFNIQNLDREPAKFNFSTDTVWTREFVIPRPGCSFVVRDFRQIEPRCLSWLVGNEPFLAGMRAGQSTYEAHARATMGWKGGELKKEDPNTYRLAKARVLALGYGCGVDNFQVAAKTMADLDLTLEECKVTVDAFRATNPLITAFWYKLDRLISSTAKNKLDRTLEIELPSGELIKYFNVSAVLKGGYRANKVKGDPKEVIHNFWGGVVAENVTQRMARDVLAHAVLNLEDAGIPVVFHSHDEGVLEVPTHTINENLLNKIDSIMCTPPSWAPDLPLAVEGVTTQKYLK